MSLSFEKINKTSELIAFKFKRDDVEPVYISEDDFEVDFSSGTKEQGTEKQLKIIKSADNETRFFPAVAKFDKKTGSINSRIYICGKSGVGKTYYFIRPYIQEFKRIYPKAKIYFYSSKLEDPAVDDLDIIRVTVDEEFIKNPPDIRKYKGFPNLVVMDDIQDYKIKSHNIAVQRLRDELMRNSRSIGCALLYLWHQPNDFRATKDMIFEATAICIFPKTSGHSDYSLLMDKYLGIQDVKKRNILKKAKSEFVYITKKNPAYAITDNYIMIL